MEAKQCDVCGTLYECAPFSGDIRIFIDQGPWGDKRLDLCEGCQKKLDDFIKNGKWYKKFAKGEK